MAFNLSDAGITDLSTITLNTFAASNASNLNSYARVTALTGDDITIDTSTQTSGAYEQFAAGNEILIHVSATQGAGWRKYLGRWAVATISSANHGVLTLSRDFTQTLPATEFAHYYVQAITIAHFDTLALDSGVSIIPKAFSESTYTGGIVALKCNTLNLNGGHIDLRDRGIPTTSNALRPWTDLEAQAKLDTDPYSGWENAETKERFMLNVGDGAAFIINLKSVSVNTNSRIGNPSTAGAFACRGASNSPNLPEGVTNIGGSTILAVLPFVPKDEESHGGCKYMSIFAKYRSSTSAEGQGLARCYIASAAPTSANANTDGPYGWSGFEFGDGGLAASDNIHSGEARNLLGVGAVGFGDGSFGAVTNYTGQLNNYARITGISNATITYTNKTTAGLAPIQAGALVMIHLMHRHSAKDTAYRHMDGGFELFKVLSDNGSQLVLDRSPGNQKLGPNRQIISIPQFSDFTLNGTNSATPKYENGQGGICAIAVDGTCDISGGKLSVEGKGGSFNDESFVYAAQATTHSRLPIGAGHGSVFILARNLIMNEDTRIGATYTGDKLGGHGREVNGHPPTYIVGKGGGYKGGDGSYNSQYASQSYTVSGGHGGAGGVCASSELGKASNGGITTFYTSGVETLAALSRQGAHIMIIADRIENFTIAALSTGGKTPNIFTDAYGGCGYGGAGWGLLTCGGGGYHGGGAGDESGGRSNGGGAAGLAFVYCNTAVNQNLSGIVIEDDQ